MKAEKVIYCTNCGSKLKGDNFCPECGEKVSKEEVVVERGIKAKVPPREAIITDTETKKGTVKLSNSKTLAGIEGWLAIFTLGLIISIGYSAYNSYTYLKLSNSLTQYSGSLVLIGLLFAGLGTAQIVLLVNIVKKKEKTKKLVIAMLVINFVVYLIEAGLVSQIVQSMDSVNDSSQYENAGRAFLYMAVWGTYFDKSKRVKETLVN